MYSNAALLIAIALNILALIYKFFPPKKINTWYGYHMKSSMRNQDTWIEANNYSGRLLILLSILFLFAALVSSSFNYFSALELSLFAFVLLLSCAGIYYLTEMHMKNVFDESGKRKQLKDRQYQSFNSLTTYKSHNIFSE